MNISTFVSPSHNAEGAQAVVDAFRAHKLAISSENHELNAFEVLQVVSTRLTSAGFLSAFTHGVKSKKSIELAADDPNRSLVSRFDAFNSETKTGVVIHAGRGLTNNDYLRSLLHASLTPEVRNLVIAVRNKYRTSEDYIKVRAFLEVLMASQNTTLDLDSVTLIGY